ncbi:MAG: flagellar hook-associated protein FlgK [Chloroflexi bacterium]|nr:flagellar hook-associated protein FlgK [Chloroflexota bacterium]
MRSAFLALDIARRALLAQQQAIDVTAHNIANASTPGFSRQRITFATTPPYPAPTLYLDSVPGQIGTGVTVTSVQRVRDTFLDYQIRTEQQSVGEWEAKRDSLQRVEVLLNEPSDSGLNSLLSKFWSSWQELSVEPDDMAVRASLLEEGKSLASILKRDYLELDAIWQELGTQLTQKVQEISDLAAQIASLNVQIKQSQVTGNSANDLKDRRDQLLDNLSGMVGVSYVVDSNDSVNVLLSGRVLVSGGEAAQLQTVQGVGGAVQIQWSSDGAAVTVSGGELKGLQDLRNTIIPDKIANLQELASKLITDVNALHSTGYDLDDGTGAAFFTGAGANDVAVSATLGADVKKVAAASVSGSPGDGSLALAIARLEGNTTQLAATSELAPGTALATSGLTVERVILNGAGANVDYTLTSSAAGTLTLTGVVDGVTRSQTLTVQDMTTAGFQSLDFAELGVKIDLAGGGASATAANIITDLTNAATDSVSTESRVTTGGYYQGMIATLGLDARRAAGMAESQSLLVAHLNSRKEEMSGVSLDEETVNLVKYQHAYQAAARLVTVIDEVLETLIGRTGLVGR